MIDFFKIVEANISALKRKQKSVTKLFPTFYDRVKKVADKGGVRLVGTDEAGWMFQVHSGTKDDVWYDVDVVFKDVEKALKKAAKSKDVWNKDKTKFDYRKLAKRFFKIIDLQIECSCPAFLFWGPAYILSQDKYDAKTPPKETRPPDIRNPKKYSAHCKHLENVFKVLPFYHNTLSKWLKEYNGDLVNKIEKEYSSQRKAFKSVGKSLGKRVRESKEIWQMTKKQWLDSLPKKKGNDVFYVTLGNNKKVEVIQNPTSLDYKQIQKEVMSNNPGLVSGDITTRFTEDAGGNRYIWKAGEATHSQIESEIEKKFGYPVSQNEVDDSLHKREVRRALSRNKPVPARVLEDYPYLRENKLQEFDLEDIKQGEEQEIKPEIKLERPSKYGSKQHSTEDTKKFD